MRVPIRAHRAEPVVPGFRQALPHMTPWQQGLQVFDISFWETQTGYAGLLQMWVSISMIVAKDSGGVRILNVHGYVTLIQKMVLPYLLNGFNVLFHCRDKRQGLEIRKA
jgi:hypothetical protein